MKLRKCRKVWHFRFLNIVSFLLRNPFIPCTAYFSLFWKKIIYKILLNYPCCKNTKYWVVYFFSNQTLTQTRQIWKKSKSGVDESLFSLNDVEKLNINISERKKISFNNTCIEYIFTHFEFKIKDHNSTFFIKLSLWKIIISSGRIYIVFKFNSIFFMWKQKKRK